MENISLVVGIVGLFGGYVLGYIHGTIKTSDIINKSHIIMQEQKHQIIALSRELIESKR